MDNTQIQSEAHPVPNYAVIFGVLLVLTVVTVAVSRLHLGFIGNLAIAMTVASGKGLLVAMYFMHLKFERRTLIYVVAVPLFFFIVLVLGLIPDLCFGPGA